MKKMEAVVEIDGGVDLLECVGFCLQEEAGEMWAVTIQVSSDQQLSLINQAVCLLEPPPQPQLPSGFSIRRSPETSLLDSDKSSGDLKQVLPQTLSPVDEPEQPQKIDRQVRVFFSAAESNAAKIDQPDSFYSLSASELKREADARKKQIAESQLLIPKSYKEREAKEARKKYKTTTIRVQFPDEVLLQAVLNFTSVVTMMDKGWIHLNRTTIEYREGVKNFVKFAKLKLGDSNFRCPCVKCQNFHWGNEQTVEDHLVINGMDETYDPWVWHGEPLESEKSGIDTSETNELE